MNAVETDKKILESVKVTLEKGNKTTQDEYIIRPITDDILIITDTYVRNDNPYYDLVGTGGKVWRSVSMKNLSKLGESYLLVHALYVLRLVQSQDKDQIVQAILRRIIKRESKRLKAIKSIEDKMYEMLQQYR